MLRRSGSLAELRTWLRRRLVRSGEEVSTGSLESFDPGCHSFVLLFVGSVEVGFEPFANDRSPVVCFVSHDISPVVAKAVVACADP